MSDMHQPSSVTTPRPGVARPTSRAWKRSGIAIAALAAVGLGASRFVGGAKAEAPADSHAPSVTVALPLERSVTEWDDYVGRFVASQSVMVKPRVSGLIVARRFKDGDLVKQGAPPVPHRRATVQSGRSRGACTLGQRTECFRPGTVGPEAGGRPVRRGCTIGK